jgi:hypothetical protein
MHHITHARTFTPAAAAAAAGLAACLSSWWMCRTRRVTLCTRASLSAPWSGPRSDSCSDTHGSGCVVCLSGGRGGLHFWFACLQSIIFMYFVHMGCNYMCRDFQVWHPPDLYLSGLLLRRSTAAGRVAVAAAGCRSSRHQLLLLRDFPSPPRCLGRVSWHLILCTSATDE